MALFTINDDDIEKIHKAIRDFGEGAEKVLNEYLQTEASEKFKTAITNLIPVSDRNKTHAKNSNPIEGKMVDNLALYMHSIKRFNYLYFPDEGEGTSIGQPHDFMQKGIDSEYDTVVNEMLDRLIQKF